MTLRIATCAYPVEQLADYAAYASKQQRLVAEAAAAGAQLLVFPEYACVELTSTLPSAERNDARHELLALQPLLAALPELYSGLAHQHAVHILAPSMPELDAASGRYHNRVRLHAPNGRVGIAHKLQMTRFEREAWGISASDTSTVFDTALGVLGIAICYDSEFPLVVRRQVALGADVILVPSCTDTLAGYHRVALSCRARALENQCYTVQASTVGAAAWSLAIDDNHGRGAVYGPVDHGFASDGIVAAGEVDRPGWVHAELDLEALATVRARGQVTNHADWDLPAHLQGNATRVRL